MNKKALLGMMLALVMMLSGCALIEMDPQVDRDTVALTVGDTAFTKGEVVDTIQMYYGDLSGTDSEYRRMAQESIVDYLAQQAVLDQKIKELGLDQLTDEEEAEVQTQADEAQQLDRETLRAQMTFESDDEAAVEAELDSYLEMVGATRESYESYARATVIDGKLLNYLFPEAAIEESDIQAAYEGMVEEHRTIFEDSPELYGEYLSDELDVYYAPEGYRRISILKSDPALGQAEAAETYAVCAQTLMLDEAVVNAAMALLEPGDVAAPVVQEEETVWVRFDEEIPSGPVALEQVSTQARERALTTRQEEAFQEQMTLWMEGAQINADYNVINR